MDDRQDQRSVVRDAIEQREQKSESAVPFLRSTRFVICCLLMMANLICYADRTNISVAILAMAEDQGWDEEQQGFVLAAFFYGYMLTQILGGM